MSTLAQNIWKGIGIGIMTVLLTAAAVWGIVSRPSDQPCVMLNYVISDLSERQYVTENELNSLLRSNGIYPVGKQMNIVSLHRIEQVAGSHPMVRTAECYMTPRNEVFVRITQRVPLLRVQTPGEAYLIDTDRRVMEARTVVRDSVLTVTGTVGVQAATSRLADFAEWLQDHSYWRQRIDYVRLQSPQTVYLYLRGADQPRILIGTLRDYERKLKKLRLFLDNSEGKTEGKQYKELDVRFKGQVIGREPYQQQ